MRTLWLVGSVWWMTVFYFIPIPHWSLWIGWPLLGAYLGLYLLGFVVAGRWLVHKWHWPLWLAVPVTWTGGEYLRCHVFGGLGLGLLGHTQYRELWIIQLADWGGAYLISFVLAMAAAWVAHVFNSHRLGTRVLAAFGAVVVVVAAMVTGWAKFHSKSTNTSRSVTSVSVQAVIIQGSIDVVFASAERRGAIEQQHHEQYRDLAHAARRKYPGAQVLIWPESTFLAPDFIPDQRESKLDEAMRDRIELWRDHFFGYWAEMVGLIPATPSDQPLFGEGVSILAGAGSMNPVTDEIFNSVLMIDDEGQIMQRYLKNHCVPFGEYVPLAQWFPILDRLHPYGRSLTFGTRPEAFHVHGIMLSPSICFESTVPHVIRGQVRQLAKEGIEVDYLVNITNDGWFFGTSCLDLHLACTVFRAVEMGKPVLVSANTGFSAEIDHRGAILQQGPRRRPELLPVTLQKSGSHKPTWYRRNGDWPWILCAGIMSGAVLSALAHRSQTPRRYNERQV